MAEHHHLVTQSLLSIAGSVIRQDDAGRFCLNDLHRAAGGEKRHAPNEWLRNKQAVELIDALAKPGIPGLEQNQPLRVAHGGDAPGTYVVKELVYAYAMWISPKFHLQVIRAYDMMATAPSPHLIPQSLPEALRLAADLAEQKAQVEAQLSIAAPKADALDRIATADGCLGLQAAGKALQQRPNKFVDWMRQHGWIYRRAGSNTNLGREEKVRAGYLTHKVKTVELPDGSERVCEQVMITPKGLSRLAQLFGVEPMNGNDGVTA